MLELNDVLLEGAPQTLSLMAHDRELCCLAGGTASQRLRWLYAMMGFEQVVSGYISIDGEPLTRSSASAFRRRMAFAPAGLTTEGEVIPYPPPTVQQVFALKANRQKAISNGILSEELRHTGFNGDQARWLAVAVLLDRPILLVESPPPAAIDYLKKQSANRTVVLTSDAPAVLNQVYNIVDIT